MKKDCCEKCEKYNETPVGKARVCTSPSCSCHNPLSSFLSEEEKEFERLVALRVKVLNGVRYFDGVATIEVKNFYRSSHARLLSKIQEVVEKLKREDDFRKLPNMGVSDTATYVRIADKNKVYNTALSDLSSLLQEAIKR